MLTEIRKISRNLEEIRKEKLIFLSNLQNSNEHFLQKSRELDVYYRANLREKYSFFVSQKAKIAFWKAYRTEVVQFGVDGGGVLMLGKSRRRRRRIDTGVLRTSFTTSSITQGAEGSILERVICVSTDSFQYSSWI